jgi:hypothetical protein
VGFVDDKLTLGMISICFGYILLASTVDPRMNGLTRGVGGMIMPIVRYFRMNGLIREADGLIMPIVRYFRIVCVCVYANIYI